MSDKSTAEQTIIWCNFALDFLHDPDRSGNVIAITDTEAMFLEPIEYRYKAEHELAMAREWAIHRCPGPMGHDAAKHARKAIRYLSKHARFSDIHPTCAAATTAVADAGRAILRAWVREGAI